MRIGIFITILLAILLVIFTIQNSEIVSVKLFFRVFEISRALLIIICIFIGFLIGILIPRRKAKSVNTENDKTGGVF